MVCRSRHGAWPSWPASWSPRGWSTTSATWAFASCSARRACRFNAQRPGRPPATSTTPPRRPASNTSTRSPTARSYPRTLNPKSSYPLDEFGPLNLEPHPRPAVGRARRQQQRCRPGAEAPRTGDLRPPARGQASVRRLRPGPGQALRPRQAEEEPDEVPALLPLPADPLPAARPSLRPSARLRPRGRQTAQHRRTPHQQAQATARPRHPLRQDRHHPPRRTPHRRHLHLVGEMIRKKLAN